MEKICNMENKRKDQPFYHPSPLQLARVVAINPEHNTVDLMLIESNSWESGIDVLSLSASKRSGIVNLPLPGKNPSGEKFIVEKSDDELMAVVGLVRGNWVVLGFLFPEVSQMLFERDEFSVNRHGSDVYQTIDSEGNVEFYHPSGTFFRLAELTPHEDLTKQDFDKKWEIKRNTDKVPSFHMEIRNGGELKATVDISGDGNITINGIGTLNLNSDGDMSISSGTKVTVTAPAVDINSA